MLREFKYLGEIEGKLCVICKLPFEDDKTILSCPGCKSLFHRNHLINWLKINSNCPICSRDFSEEIEKYSLRESNKGNQLEINDIDKLPFTEFKFTRPLIEVEKEPLTVSQKVFAIFLGLYLGFAIQVGFALTIPFPKSLLFCLIDFPFYLMGVSLFRALLVKPKVESTDLWEDIVFTEKGLVVKNPDLSLNEFVVEDLRRLELTKSNESSKKDSVTKYTITLKLIEIKEKKYNFGAIYSSTDNLQRDHIYSTLVYQIRNYYSISTIPTPRFFVIDFIIENPRFIGLSVIGYILLKVVLTLVGYFFIAL